MLSLVISFAFFISIFYCVLLHYNTVMGIDPKSIYFDKEINISKNNGTSQLPQVTAEGNNVYVVWQDNTGGNYDVFFAYSPDNGRNFKSVNLSKNNGTSQLPQVTAEGNNVYVVWQDNTGGNYDVFTKSSSNGGIKFKSSRNLSKNNGTSELPQIASTKDSFYVSWKDYTNGNISAFFKEGRKNSPTSNIEFGTTKRIINNANISKPLIFFSGGTFVSVWTVDSGDSSLIRFFPIQYFEDSTDAFQLTASYPSEKISNVSISGYDGGIYYVWETKKIPTSEIFFKRMHYASIID